MPKRLGKKTRRALVNVPNMQHPAFCAAATGIASKLRLTDRFTTMPSEQDLREPDAIAMHGFIKEALLQFVPSQHQKSWQKILAASFPEIERSYPLDHILLILVVRCWQLRQTAGLFALHEFVEFCSGFGNLTLACLQVMLHCVALDVAYHPDQNMLTRIGLRVWIDAISETKPLASCWWGTRCSSFVGLSKRHHKRSEVNGFWGNSRMAFVREGNMMQVP